MAKIPTLSTESVGPPNAMSSTTAGRVGQSSRTLIGSSANQEEFKGAATPLAKLLEKTRLDADRAAVDEYETGLMVAAAEIKTKWGSRRGKDVLGAQDGAAADFDKMADELDQKMLATGSQKRAGAERRNGIGASLVNSMGVYEAKEAHRHNVQTKQALMSEHVSSYAGSGTDQERIAANDSITAIANELADLTGMSRPMQDAYQRKVLGEASEGRVRALMMGNRYSDARSELKAGGANIDSARRESLDRFIEKEENDFVTTAAAEKYHLADVPETDALKAMERDIKPGQLVEAQGKYIALQRNADRARDMQDSDILDKLGAGRYGSQGELLREAKANPESVAGMSNSGWAELHRQDESNRRRKASRRQYASAATAQAILGGKLRRLTGAMNAPSTSGIFDQIEKIDPDMTQPQYADLKNSIEDAPMPRDSKNLAHRLLDQGYKGRKRASGNASKKRRAMADARREISQRVSKQEPFSLATHPVDGEDPVSLSSEKAFGKNKKTLIRKRQQFDDQVRNHAMTIAMQAVEDGKTISPDEYSRLVNQSIRHLTEPMEGTNLERWFVYANIDNPEEPISVNVNSKEIHGQVTLGLEARLGSAFDLSDSDLEELNGALVSAAVNRGRKGYNFHLQRFLDKKRIPEQTYADAYRDVIAGVGQVDEVTQTGVQLAPRDGGATASDRLLRLQSAIQRGR